jgi:putative Mg2+ transporter-C (MgtC) family protein
MEIFTIIFRLVLTFILSMIFGLQRQSTHKPAGIGTFTFVAIGSCGLAMAALQLYPENPLSLLGAIVTGIGFLGAGTLIKTNDKVFGVTTASSIWLFAIFGLIIGIGYYLEGFLIYTMVWSVIAFDYYLEREGLGQYQKKLVISTNRIVRDDEVCEELIKNAKKCKLLSKEISKKENKSTFAYLIEGSEKDIGEAITNISEKKWFVSFRLE